MPIYFCVTAALECCRSWRTSSKTADKDMSVNIGDREIARANNRGQKAMGLRIRTT